MSVQLMSRLSRALTLGEATLPERRRITDAMKPGVDEFEQLPHTVQALVERLELRGRT